MATSPRRLIICVDGTWCTPDGSWNRRNGNLTNIYRLFMSIKEGQCYDEHGRPTFFQEKHYEKGIGSADGINAFERLKTGALGGACIATIKKLYLLCCDLTEQDEVWLFGFSRGAYIIRAVAGLLHHFGALKATDARTLSKDYESTLKIYREQRQLSTRNLMSGKLLEHLRGRSKAGPHIAFVGAFDTVKAVRDENLYDLSYNESIKTWRHALALNESRGAFQPDYGFSSQEHFKSRSRSFIQAWFLGAHIDVGGSAAKDGLALYPLQWMLLEAQSKGLVLEFDEQWKKQVTVDNPLSLLCSGARRTVTLSNKISVEMQELDLSHKSYQGRYEVHLNKPPRAFYSQESREVFDKGEPPHLNGWCSYAPQGTIIHPSVYLLFDKHTRVFASSRDLQFRDDLEAWRRNIVGPDDQFWEEQSTPDIEGLTHVRILVCGNTGVGKSTLINNIFGIDDKTKVSHTRPGMHDINEEIKDPACPTVILHDSGGLKLEKRQKYKLSRTSSEESHTILTFRKGCMRSELENGARLVQGGTKRLFQTISEVARDVPVVIVCTKRDKFDDFNLGKGLRLATSNQLQRGSDPMEVARAYMEEQVRMQVQHVSGELEKMLDRHFDAVAVVSSDDPNSHKNLVLETERSFTHEKLRILYVSAQIADVDAKIDQALVATMRIHGQAVGSATFGGAVPLASSVTNGAVSLTIVKEIWNIFGVPSLSAQTLFDIILTEFLDDFKHNFSVAMGEGLAAAGLFGTVMTGMPVVLLSGAINIALVVPATIRMMLMLACDVTLILTHAYRQAAGKGIRRPMRSDVAQAAREYRISGTAAEVHRAIKKLVPRRNVTKSYRADRIKARLGAIVKKHKNTLIESSELIMKQPKLISSKTALISDDESDDDEKEWD